MGAVKAYSDVTPDAWRERLTLHEARYGVLELPLIGASH